MKVNKVAVAKEQLVSCESASKEAVMPMVTPVMTPIVWILPSEPAHHDAIRKYGNWFWAREANGGYTRLIPIDRNGIPHVAAFIFVPNADIRTTDSQTARRIHSGEVSKQA